MKDNGRWSIVAPMMLMLSMKLDDRGYNEAEPEQKESIYAECVDEVANEIVEIFA